MSNNPPQGQSMRSAKANKKRGWTHFTPTKVRRYFRHVEGKSFQLEERMDASGVEWRLDRVGGLHALCTQGELWTILSGKPATW